MQLIKFLTLTVAVVALLSLTQMVDATCQDDPLLSFRYVGLGEKCDVNNIPKNFLTCDSIGNATSSFVNKTCTEQQDCEPFQCAVDPYDPTQKTCQPQGLEAGASCFGPGQCLGSCVTQAQARAEYQARGFPSKVWAGLAADEVEGGYGSVPSSYKIGDALAEDLVIKDGICVAAKSNNTRCTSNFQCPALTFCRDGFCRDSIPVGGDCTEYQEDALMQQPNWVCASGSSCEATSAGNYSCVAYYSKQEGDYCEFNSVDGFTSCDYELVCAMPENSTLSHATCMAPVQVNSNGNCDVLSSPDWMPPMDDNSAVPNVGQCGWGKVCNCPQINKDTQSTCQDYIGVQVKSKSTTARCGHFLTGENQLVDCIRANNCPHIGEILPGHLWFAAQPQVGSCVREHCSRQLNNLIYCQNNGIDNDYSPAFKPLEVTPPTSSEIGDSGLPGWAIGLIILGVGIGVVMLIVVIVLVMKRRRPEYETI